MVGRQLFSRIFLRRSKQNSNLIKQLSKLLVFEFLNQIKYNFTAEVTEYIIIGYPGRNWVILVTKLSIDHSQWQKVISQRNHLVSVGCGGLRAAPYLAKLLNAADCGLMQSGTLDVWSCSAMNLWISSADSSCN